MINRLIMGRGSRNVFACSKLYAMRQGRMIVVQFVDFRVVVLMSQKKSVQEWVYQEIRSQCLMNEAQRSKFH